LIANWFYNSETAVFRPKEHHMAEKPILFSGEMVRAILDGRKTQTRRVIKFPKHVPDFVTHDIASVNPDGRGDWVAWSPRPVTDEQSKKMYPNGGGFICPYGPGDLLWVRETWATWRMYDDVKPSELSEDVSLWWPANGSSRRELHHKPGKNRPSIFMPRWASRITLRVTDVRVERVQDISADDAIFEGAVDAGVVAAYEASEYTEYGDEHEIPDMCIDQFRALWESINGPRGFGWDENPWVWVVEFEMVR
jgi:hypothetical protein